MTWDEMQGLLIMTGQSLGLLISADFMYHYFSSVMKKVKMVIPEQCTFDI